MVHHYHLPAITFHTFVVALAAESLKSVEVLKPFQSATARGEEALPAAVEYPFAFPSAASDLSASLSGGNRKLISSP